MKGKKMPDYFWWHGKDLRGFFARVMQLGGPDSVRIRFDGKMLYVVSEDKAASDAEADQGFNFVHVCPPDCE